MAPRMREQKNMETPEFEQRLVEVARVTRVMAGGKRMRFRALLVIGDRKGRVGMGAAKAIDVTIAIQKAFNQAKKNLIDVPLHKGTIPHLVLSKHTASKILLKPAKPGAGIKAGGAVRIVLELAGVQDVTAKILGGHNKLNSVKATLDALSSFTLTPNQKKNMTEHIQKQEVEREAQAKARAKMKAQGGFKRGGKPFARRDDKKAAPKPTSTQA